MCGIIGYIGDKNALPIITDGLKRLEYRGYDSAGVALWHDHDIHVYKKKGKVNDLVSHIESVGSIPESSLGIGHTRWATHGLPTDNNAHPHLSEDNSLVVVHNGIIENNDTLKKELQNLGYTFRSNTDTEVLITFISHIKNNGDLTLVEAIQHALQKVNGAYAIVVLSKDEPNTMVAAKKGSPLCLGIGENELFLSSSTEPIANHTKNIVYLKDGELVHIENNNYKIINEDNITQTPMIEKIEFALEKIEKGDFKHFMLKEIYEQPRVLNDCMRGRIKIDDYQICLGGISDYLDTIANANRIIMLACGTSWHAALVGEYIFEELCRIPVEVEYASEFRYRNPVVGKGDVILSVSQSGETADTLAAMTLAKQKGAVNLAICNVVGSSISRLSHAGVYTHAGPEIGVASTKAFTSQVIVLTMMALQLASQRKSLAKPRFNELLFELHNISLKVENCIALDSKVKKIAKKYMDAKNFLYLGRGYNFPIALEGALKLKEISYIHAEGYPAAEMKHGPIALIDEDMPVVCIATRDQSYDKVISNIREVKARNGKVIAIITKGDILIPEMVDDYVEIPNASDIFIPLLSVVPLQLLAYYIATYKGCNVDQPRNLAKSVTVE